MIAGEIAIVISIMEMRIVVDCAAKKKSLYKQLSSVMGPKPEQMLKRRGVQPKNVSKK